MKEENVIMDEEFPMEIDLGDESTFYIADNGNFFGIRI